MFHLLADQTVAILPDIEIPFVATKYDEGPFQEYGVRQGYPDFYSLLQLHRERPFEFESFLQTWFFFGLLYEFLGDSLDMDDFALRDGSPRRLVSHKAMRRHCTDWFRKMFASSEETRQEILARVSQSLAFVTIKSNEIDAYLHQDPSAAPVIMFSVKVLIEAFTVIMKRFALPLPDEEFPTPEWQPIRPKPSLFLLDSMLQSGWCPYRLAGISASVSSIAIYHLRGFHYPALIGEDHEGCDEAECHIDNLSDYTPQHDANCSSTDCKLAFAPIEKLVGIYSGNDIPVLSCVLEPSGEILIDAVSSSQASGYVAISHVWSDGLGNEHENAIYDCQLRRLIKEVQMLRSKEQHNDPSNDQTPITVWLDTMCIPVATEYDGIRRIAIGRMDWTYAAADAVLIQDKALHRLTPSNLFPLQFAAHLHCSKWLSRCWTLAEGTLAWKWHIQFSDSALSLAQISVHFASGQREAQFDEYVARLRIQFLQKDRQRVFNELMEEPQRQATFDEFLEESITSDFMSIYKEIPPHTSEVSLTFAEAWNALLHRSTTKPEDAHGIFGLMVGLSIKQIISLDKKKKQRMKAVLNKFHLLPTSLLFNHGPKLRDEPKNRWVPEHVQGNFIKDSGWKMFTYDEGRMVGPLSRSKFLIYKFQGLLSEKFVLLDNENQKEFNVRILGTSPREEFLPEQEWLLIFPEDIGAHNLLETISFTAMCVAIRREKSEDPPRILASWEYLVQVDSFQPRPVSPLIIEGHWTQDKAALYIECDMTDWPQPTTRDWFSPHQKRSIPYLVWIAGDWGLVPWTIIATIIEIFVSIVEIAETKSVKLSGGGRPLIALLATLVFLAGLSIHHYIKKRKASYRINDEAKRRQKWAENFLETGPRKQNSWRLRFLLWLRQPPKPSKSAACDDIELEDLRFQNQTSGLSPNPPPTQPMSDLLRIVQVVLAVIEIGFIVLFKRKQSHEDNEYLSETARALSNFIIFNCVVTPLATLAIWIELNRYTGASKGEFGPGRTRASRVLEGLVALFWFVGFLAMRAFLRNNRVNHGRSLGWVSVAIATLEWLIVIPLFLFRASNFLKFKAWPKHTRTLDDLFEDHKVLGVPIEDPGDCFCFNLPFYWLDRCIRIVQRMRRRRIRRIESHLD